MRIVYMTRYEAMKRLGRGLLQTLLLGIMLCLPIASLQAQTVQGSSTIPNDTYWDRQWYLRQIHLPEAWAIKAISPGVKVAILDGGVDITHPELQQNIWVNSGEIPGDGLDNDQNGFIDDVHGWNFVTRNNQVGPVVSRHAQAEETWSHGTFVASLIGAAGNNSAGIAGVSWRIQLMPLVVLDGDGFGNIQNVINAVRYAIHERVDIINLSLSGAEYSQELEAVLLEAYQAGILIVAATGNNEASQTGVNTDEYPIYPACLDAQQNIVFGVGGTDTLDQKAPYANFGRACTDIVAPAQEFFGARPTYRRPSDTATTTAYYLNGMTGTSLAAPLVTGAAALLKAVRPELTPRQIEEALQYSADPIEGNLKPEERGRMGAGRLNVWQALLRIAPGGITPEMQFLREQRAQSLVFSAFLDQEWRLWTHPGTPMSGAWVNTSTRPEAFVLNATTTTWAYEVWDPRTNHVSSTVLWRQSDHLPVPLWRAASSSLFLIERATSSLLVVKFDPLTGKRHQILLPAKLMTGSLRLLWWPERQGWIVWSSSGFGVFLDTRLKVRANLEARIKGAHLRTAELQLKGASDPVSLKRQGKLVSTVRITWLP